MKTITPKRKYLIDRLGYLRSRAKISARELSQHLDRSIAYIAKFENGDFNIPAETLLSAIEICGGTTEEFFWPDISKYQEHKKFLDMLDGLSSESKNSLFALMKTMK